MQYWTTKTTTTTTILMGFDTIEINLVIWMNCWQVTYFWGTCLQSFKHFKGILSPQLVLTYIMSNLLLSTIHIVSRLKNCVFSLKIKVYYQKLVIVRYQTRLLKSKSCNQTRLLKPNLVTKTGYSIQIL